MEEFDSIICKVLRISKEQLSEHLTSDDISSWDSLTQFALIASLESNYHITFEMEELFSIVTIGDIRSIFQRKINKKS